MAAAKKQLEPNGIAAPSRLVKGKIFGLGLLHTIFPALDETDSKKIRIETVYDQGSEPREPGREAGAETLESSGAEAPIAVTVPIVVTVPNNGEFVVALVVKGQEDGEPLYGDGAWKIVDGQVFCDVLTEISVEE